MDPVLLTILVIIFALIYDLSNGWNDSANAIATTILVNTLTGVPISTTHSITGAIVGVGAIKGWRSVKWVVGGKILFAWLVTFPLCISGGALIFELLQRVGMVAK